MIFSTKDGRAANQIRNGDWMQDQTKTNFRTFKVALNPMYRICLNFAIRCISSCYQNSIIGQKFTVSFLKYERLKLKLRVFLGGHSVAVVTYCVTKIIPTCSPMTGQCFDAMIVA